VIQEKKEQREKRDQIIGVLQVGETGALKKKDHEKMKGNPRKG